MRERTGEGQHIDISMRDSMFFTDDYAHHALDDEPVVRLGGQVFDAVEGPILVTGEFKHIYRQLARVHDVSDGLAADAPLDDKIARRREAVAAWTMSFASRRDLKAALEKANLAWADVRSHRDAFALARAADVDDRGGGTRRVINSPYVFSDAASGIHRPAAFRGEHNAEVLHEWLGLSAADVADLEESGALGHQ